MKAVIFSDVHSNVHALNAVLAHMPLADGVICLGDTVGYATNPSECMKQVRSHCAIVIQGNHDKTAANRGATDGTDDYDEYNGLAQDGINFSLNNLSEDDRTWLKGLPLRVDGDIGGRPVVYVHGDLSGNRCYLEETSAIVADLKTLPAGSLLFCGHTHRPLLCDADGRYYPTDQTVLSKDKSYLINVGSVGQPRDHDNRACYVTVDSSEQGLLIEWHRVAYDIDDACNECWRHGLRECGERLFAGV